MNVLAIGNSFSQDATRYLHGIAAAAGEDLTVVNLYIPGCPLDLHAKLAESDERRYSLEYNGESTGFFVSIREALESRKWDYVTMQQVSHKSNDYSTYQPWLSKLSDFVKRYAPDARQIIHMTWPYEEGSTRLCKELKYSAQSEMYEDIENAYVKAAISISAYNVILSGKIMYQLSKIRMAPVYRDTFHASLGFGRYALGLLWYKTLTGNNVTGNTFDGFDEPIPPETAAELQKFIDSFFER